MEITLHKHTKTTTVPIEYLGAKWTETTFETASGEKLTVICHPAKDPGESPDQIQLPLETSDQPA